MRHASILLFSLLLFHAVSEAADVTGKWKGAFEGQNGSVEVTFDLKASGEALTGNVAFRERQLEIKEGKVQGSTVTFFVMSEWQGEPVKLVYKGELAGDQIKFTMGTEDGGWSTELTARRVS